MAQFNGEGMAYATEEEQKHYLEDEKPRHTEHALSLGAKRLLSDETVQVLFNRLLDQFGTNSIMSTRLEDREKSREQFLVVSGIKATLEQFARGEIPTDLL